MNWLSLFGLEGWVARWRANVIEGAIAVEDRVDLVMLEWTDQKRRLIQMVVLALIAGGLTVIALIMLSLAILVQFWDSPDRATVAWLLAALWGIGWIAVLISIAIIAKRAGNAFALTKQVLASDWKYVKDRL